MSEPNFDTLAASQKLQDSSFERQQAEGVIGVIVDAQQNLVTKNDLKQVEDRLTGEIKLLSGEIKGVSDRLDSKFEMLDGKIDVQGKVLASTIDALGDRLRDKKRAMSGSSGDLMPMIVVVAIAWFTFGLSMALLIMTLMK